MKLYYLCGRWFLPLFVVWTMGFAAIESSAETSIYQISVVDSHAPWIRTIADVAASYTSDPDKSSQLRDYIEQRDFKAPLPSQSDFDFALEAMLWVTQQWKHDGWSAAPQNAGGLDILKLVHNEGARFRCVEYGTVLRDILRAYGFYTRTIGMITEDSAYGGFGKGHIATEFWLNDPGKWIYFDPQFGTFVSNSAGEPLNFYELFREVEESGWDQVHVTWLVEHERDDIEDISKFYEEFIENSFGSLSVTIGDRSFELGLRDQQVKIVFQGMPQSYSFFTSRAEDIYPDMNVVELTLAYDYNRPNYGEIFEPIQGVSDPEQYDEFFRNNLHRFAAKPHFKVNFKSNAVHLSHYEYKISNTPDGWQRVDGESVPWSINKGDISTLYVRIVDAFGRAGPSSYITISYLESAL